MKLTFLGTGTSHGVPPLDCMLRNYENCPKNVCKESFTDTKHKRTRSSVLIEYNSKTVLIDVSSDFREQALRENIHQIDAVLITHNHSDHVSGIPDIRSYTKENSLPFFGAQSTLQNIKQSFNYIFNPPLDLGGGIPQISLNPVSTKFNLFKKDIIPLPVIHGSLKDCFGYRIDNMAYIPDVKFIPPATLDLIKGVEILIIDCVRIEKKHSTHIILSESLEIAREINPAKCYFTHLSHLVHYQLDSKLLDSWMSFAFDGQTLEF